MLSLKYPAPGTGNQQMTRAVHHRSVFRSFIDLLFPPVCPLCELDLQEDGLCGRCLALLSAHRTKDPACSVCGIPFASGEGDSRPCGACLKEDRPFIEARSAFTYDKA